MKNKIAMFLVVAMFWACCLPAYAAEVASEVNEPVLNYEFLSSAEIAEENGMVVVSRTIPVNESTARSISDEVSMVKETIALIPKEDTTVQDIIAELNTARMARGTGDNMFEDYDDTGSIKMYTRIYYNTKTVNGERYALLTKVDGGYTILDSSVSLSSQSVELKCMGRGTYNQRVTKTPSVATRNWSYTAPSTWQYAEELAVANGVGVAYIAKLSGWGNTWNAQLNNNVAFNWSI